MPTDHQTFLQATLDHEQAALFALYQKWFDSDDPFPVDLEQVDIYGKKHHAVTALRRRYLENIDYIVQKNCRKANKVETRGGHNRDNIFLSILCLKDLLLSQYSVQGKRYRRYYLLFEELVRTQWKKDRVSLASLEETVKEYKLYSERLDKHEAVDKNEAFYQKLLDRMFPIQLDKSCQHGIMDLHLADRIIEIKHWDKYKHCLGQLLAYSTGTKELVAVVFGRAPTEDVQTCIKSLLTKYGIALWYFDASNHLILPLCQPRISQIPRQMRSCNLKLSS